MKGKLFVLAGCLWVVWAFAAPEGDDVPRRFSQRLLEHVQRYPQEKVYLHTDRDHYEAGERVWFRAYLVNAVSHVPSDWSQFVYVELRDRQDSLFARVKVGLRDSVYAGYVPLAKTLPQGDYVLRAYSYWMQNGGDDYIFRKRIRVVSPQDSKVLTEMKEEETEEGAVAVVRFYNTRNECYGRVGVRYVVGDRARVRWTDEEGVLRVKLGEEDYGKKMEVSFVPVQALFAFA